MNREKPDVVAVPADLWQDMKQIVQTAVPRHFDDRISAVDNGATTTEDLQLCRVLAAADKFHFTHMDEDTLTEMYGPLARAVQTYYNAKEEDHARP